MENQNDEVGEGLAFAGLSAITIALLITAVLESGCTTGGYLQVGYIPVTEVSDVHRTIPQRPRVVKAAVRQEQED